MTDREREAAGALERVRMDEGALGKRFVRAMARKARQDPEAALSEAEAAYLWRLVGRYRSQVPAGLSRG